MSEANSPNELLTKITESATVSEVLEIMDQIDTGLAQGQLTLSMNDVYGIQLNAFDRLQELTVDEPYIAEPILLERVMPLCLKENPEHSISLLRVRERLANWINQYPESPRFELRNRVLDKLLPALTGPTPKAACWTLSHLGYRTSKIIEALWQIIDCDDNEIGDEALRTLSWLGYSSKEQPSFVEEVNRRARTRFSSSLVWAMARLASPESINLIYDSWLTAADRSIKQVDISLAFTAIRDILARYYDDLGLQDDTWRQVSDLVEQEPSEYSRAFDIGHIPSKCNSLLVVPALLNWTAHIAENSWGRHLLCLRLEECVMPRQIEGWAHADNVNLDLLISDACQNTNFDGMVSTLEQVTKKTAWETLLRAGVAKTLSLFAPAVEDEEGKYIQKEIMDLLSHFRITPLPDPAVKWITERFDEPSAGIEDGRGFARRFAAVQMARSAATAEAFDALLNFGYTHQKQVMMQSIEALAEVAVHLAGKGDISAIDKLVERTVNSREGHQRLAAAAALEEIAAFESSLAKRYADQIVPLLFEEQRNDLEKGTLLSALGCLSGWAIPDKLLPSLEAWARKKDRWIGGGSLFVLAKQGKLAQNESLLVDILSLQKVNDAWNVQPGKEAFEFDWAPYTIGLLYHQDPETFLPAIVTLVQHKDWRVFTQVLQWLRVSHAGPNSFLMPQEIEETLLQRIRTKQTAFYGETEIFDLMARVAPQALAREKWEESFNNWLPDSRRALAVALGEVKTNDDERADVLLRLQALALDSAYAVRRAAYRGLAHHSMNFLQALCRTWASASSIDIVLRAAEASAWLSPTESFSADDLTALFHTLAFHAEENVRETTTRAWDERRNRNWATEYQDRILKVKGESNEEILNAWCYSSAIIRIGDDFSIKAIQQHLGQTSLPPNVRFWLKSTVEEMEKYWRKTTQKWPEPWQDLRGTIEQGHGQLITSDGKAIEVQYQVWQQSDATPVEKLSWGGSISSTDVLLNVTSEKVILEDGRQGRVLLTNTYSFHDIGFIGNGPYPS